jgi:hypothetical protein
MNGRSMVAREIVLIYQMGKVASQTIEWAVRALRPGARVVRTHFLALDRYEALLPDDASDMPDAMRASIRCQQDEARAFLDVLARGAYDRPLRVITGCREPVSQCVAGCFQNIASLLPDYKRLAPSDCAAQMRELLIAAWKRQRQGLPATTGRERFFEIILPLATSWFDVEMRGVLGMDIYGQRYVPGTALVVRGGECDLMCYRVEDGAAAMLDGLERLFDAPVPALINHNIAAEKDYRSAYAVFRAAAALPAAFLDERYDSRYAGHFYGADERRDFRKAWLQGDARDVHAKSVCA